MLPVPIYIRKNAYSPHPDYNLSLFMTTIIIGHKSALSGPYCMCLSLITHLVSVFTKWLTRGFFAFGPSNFSSPALPTIDRLPCCEGLPPRLLCVLFGLCPDVEEPPSELSGGVRFCGLRLQFETIIIRNLSLVK